MSTSIVIPLGRGSRNNDLELRFCLRSIESYLTGYGEIFIIGEKPDWLRNIFHIPCSDLGDKTYDKERNIFHKIMAACNDERVSENFLFMNDDHYLRQEYEAACFPYYYEGTLSEKMTVTDYKHSVINTIGIVGPSMEYADIHCPIVYNKAGLDTLTSYDWSIQFGYCIKTLYCHNAVPPRLMIAQKDCKLNEHENDIRGRPWFSIGDKAFYWDVRALLQNLYPHKSKYET